MDMKCLFATKNRRIGGESALRKSLGRTKWRRDLSFNAIRIYSIHKWMLIADILSWLMLAVLMWGLKRLGRGKVRNMLRKMHSRSTHLF